MPIKTQRFPDYSTLIGKGTQIYGGVRFSGALHVDGQVSGDIEGLSDDGCALTLGRSGIIEGSLNVAHVVLDGTVIGDVRASRRAELAPGARIDGSIYYGVLEMAEGAEVNGKLFHIGENQEPQLTREAIEAIGKTDRQTPGRQASATDTRHTDSAASGPEDT